MPENIEKKAREFERNLSPETAHPRAREVLSEPACWKGEAHTRIFNNGYATEILADFLRWRMGHPEGPAISRLKAVLERTGAGDKHWEVVDPEAVDRLISNDEYGVEIRDHSAIGLAFAQLVYEGKVDDDVRALAMLALRRQIVATDRLWSSQYYDLDERRRCLGEMHEALGRLGPPPDLAAAPTPRRRARARRPPARKPMIVAFYGSNSTHPTEDGRVLGFGEDVVRAEIRLRFDPRDEHGELPNDVLAADLLVADADGRVWSLTSRFPSEVFVTHMVDLSALDQFLHPFPKGDRAGFQRDLLLEDVRFSSDDRFYRRFALGDRVVEAQFKYTTLSFDVAFDRDRVEAGSPSLARLKVRLNKGGLFDADAIKDVGSIGFGMDWRHLFRHNTIIPDPDGPCGLGESPLPRPLAFRPTDEQAEPQAGVRAR